MSSRVYQKGLVILFALWLWASSIQPNWLKHDNLIINIHRDIRWDTYVEGLDSLIINIVLLYLVSKLMYAPTEIYTS